MGPGKECRTWEWTLNKTKEETVGVHPVAVSLSAALGYVLSLTLTLPSQSWLAENGKR